MGINVILVIISTIIILVSIIYVATRKNKKQFHYVYILLASSVLVWCIGEEFVVILTNKTMEQSLILLESIRKAIQDESHLELNRNVTVSIGVHEYYKDEPKEEVFNNAGEALYEAKHSGKNKIIISTVA